MEIAAGQNAQGTIGQKIGDIYKLAMDSVKLNADGVTPIQADLEKIASVKDKSEIVPLMAELAHSGVFPYFSFYVGADIMDSKSNLFQLYQGGISLGEKEYYLDNDDVTVNIRNKYKEHIVKMFQLAGFDEAAAKKKMEAVMDIETRIAKASFSAVEQRNPAANYHKMSLDELKKESEDKVYMLVAHNGISRAVNAYFHYLSNEEYAAFRMDNCDILKYEFPEK
mgnify:CR=1 FL=1